MNIRPSAFPGLTTRPFADRDLYLVECLHKDTRYFVERNASDMTLAGTVDDFLSGQFENVLAVYSFNPVEGWACDESENVARAVADRARNEYRALTKHVRDFIAEHVGFSYTRDLEEV